MSEEAVANEPTIVFVVSKAQWLSVLHPVTKLDLLDWIAVAGGHFFYDASNESYVLIEKISHWQKLEDEVKKRFQLISRRVREEMDGPFPYEIKEKLDHTDPFDVFDKKEGETTAASAE
jgi:hypothetical protein